MNKFKPMYEINSISCLAIEFLLKNYQIVQKHINDVNLAKKSTNKGVLEQISSNQKKMNKNFNDLAKAVNSLATQSSE